ncbi:MAG: hypothetical protein PHD87_07800 [Candidatus Cloacimonetes bacterium]|nr:hypothetical protein [Candidatus Cloacimonadota bacterium]
MKKHPKTAFGISEDGQILRLASLDRDSYQIRISRLDLVELDRTLYQSQDQFTDYDSKTWEEDTSGEEIKIAEFGSGDLGGLKSAHMDRIFGGARLQRGVIALNVNEENLVRGIGIPETKSAERAFLRANLEPRVLKRKEWQTSRFTVNAENQLLLHKGPNQLLEELFAFARRNRARLYFQLADTNEIALADYYRVNNLGDDQRVMLLYLGRDYRRAFLFDNNQLIDIFPLNITQDFPEPEMIYSRVSFALDNSQQPEPDKYVICGDLASEELVLYFNSRNPDSTSLLGFPLLAVGGLDPELATPVYLAQFALPIALAHKALFPDEVRYTPSNFLPGYLIEAQKPFKISWHGFLIMFIVFAVAFYGTVTYLSGREKYQEAHQLQRKLDHELAVLKIETAEIARMKEEMSHFSKNLDAIRVVLQGKNPWSQVLDTLNHLFQTRPISWLTNFKRDGERLQISGITTNRNNVIAFADALPQSRIQKVTSSQIRNTTVWIFEISSDFPEVDWVGQIEAEMSALLEQRKQEQEQAAPSEEEPAPEEPAAAPEVALPQPPAPEPPAEPKPAVQIPENVTLPAISSRFMPPLSVAQNKLGGQAAADYNTFIRALNGGDHQETVKLGKAFIRRHDGSLLEPMARWHLANRLYRAGDYTQAIAVVDSLVHKYDAHYPYALLLTARIYQAKGYKRYQTLYPRILKSFPDHPIRPLIEEDMAALGLGGEQ